MRKHSRPRWDRTVPLKLGTLTTVEDAHNTADYWIQVVGKITLMSPTTDATTFDIDQSTEKEKELQLREQDGLRHCLRQLRKCRRDLERDEERVEQDDELDRAPTNRRNVEANDTNV